MNNYITISAEDARIGDEYSPSGKMLNVDGSKLTSEQESSWSQIPDENRLIVARYYRLTFRRRVNQTK